MTDPGAVAQRDAVMIAGGGDPAAVMLPIAPPTLGDGVVRHLADGRRALATGVAAFQPRIVSHDGTVGLWHQVRGAGFDLVSPIDLSRLLGPGRTAILERIGVRLVRVVELGAQVLPGCVGDIDGVLIPHLAQAGRDLVAVRPDGCLLGAVLAIDAVASSTTCAIASPSSGSLSRSGREPTPSAKGPITPPPFTKKGNLRMSLYRLTSITIGVPNVNETAAYSADFGLTPQSDASLTTVDGGQQLCLVQAPLRRHIEMGIGVDDRDDLDRISAQLRTLHLPATWDSDTLATKEPIAGFRANISLSPRMEQPRQEATPYNGPGRIERCERCAPGVVHEGPLSPLKLGDVVIGYTDQEATQRFFTEGSGFKVSGVVPSLAAFMRCSSDHQDVLGQQATVNFEHHTSRQVKDIDDIGRGVMAMLEQHPERHVWGLGRHHIGSNFFWYLTDPAANFSEYYCDMDCIVDDALRESGLWQGPKSLYNWGPPPPASFLQPVNLAGFMTGAHSAA